MRITSTPSTFSAIYDTKPTTQTWPGDGFEQLRLAIDTHEAQQTQVKIKPTPTKVNDFIYKNKSVKKQNITDKNIIVFSQEGIAALLGNAESSDTDSKKRIAGTVEKLTLSECHRPLFTPDPVWKSQLDDFREAFPNFSRVINEIVEPSFAISEIGIGRAAPVLIVGNPGIGKTYFTQSLAKLMQVPMLKMDASNATMGAELCGLDSHWGNSSPGKVFSTLAFKSKFAIVADPIGFIDEIDKSQSSRFDPLGPLHELLEIESANEFEDKSLPGLKINASYIRWILCCNNLDNVPRPIISRAHVIHIDAPTQLETLHVRARIFAQVVSATKIPDFDNSIPSSVLRGLIALGPREFKIRCSMAIGRALSRGKRCVIVQDFEVASSTTVRTRMGFM